MGAGSDTFYISFKKIQHFIFILFLNLSSKSEISRTIQPFINITKIPHICIEWSTIHKSSPCTTWSNQERQRKRKKKLVLFAITSLYHCFIVLNDWVTRYYLNSIVISSSIVDISAKQIWLHDTCINHSAVPFEN